MHELAVTQSILNIVLDYAGKANAAAELIFRRVSASFECLDCSTVYQLDGNAIYCPSCGSTRIKILSGEEFYLEAIDVET